MIKFTKVQYYQALILLTVFALPGCFGTASSIEVSAANSNNIKRLTNLYCLFQMQNRWVGPRDQNEFTTFIASQTRQSLERIGVNRAEIGSLFVSERDDRPFSIRYGVVVDGPNSHEPIIFETVGKNGNRIISFTSRKQIEVFSQEEYDSYLVNNKPRVSNNPS